MATTLPAADLGPQLGRDAGFQGLARRLGAFKPSDEKITGEELDRKRVELKTAARDFEGMFINLMLREMRPDEEEDGLFGSSIGSEFYREMFDSELSKVMSRAGQMGLAEMIERQVAELMGWEIEEEESVPGTVLGRVLPRPLRQSVAGAYKAVEESVVRAIGRFIRPLSSGQVSSRFGERSDPFDGTRRRHNGIDFAAPEGTPVRASAEGVVKFSGNKPGYGNVVIIEHAGGYESRYAHNADNLVRKGEIVREGQVVATVGNSGRSSGPHLHFEVRRDGVAVDPLRFIR
jgi:Rod binding domain-containing protein